MKLQQPTNTCKKRHPNSVVHTQSDVARQCNSWSHAPLESEIKSISYSNHSMSFMHNEFFNLHQVQLLCLLILDAKYDQSKLSVVEVITNGIVKNSTKVDQTLSKIEPLGEL